jgi:hypothetical protein
VAEKLLLAMTELCRKLNGKPPFADRILREMTSDTAQLVALILLKLLHFTEVISVLI